MLWVRFGRNQGFYLRIVAGRKIVRKPRMDMEVHPQNSFGGSKRASLLSLLLRLFDINLEELGAKLCTIYQHFVCRATMNLPLTD
jgi:hypothetical protein